MTTPSRSRPCPRLVGIAMALCTGSAFTGAAPVPPRDWSAFPAVVQMETPHAIYALGDVHGDYDKMAALLAAAGIIRAVPDKPELVQWTAGKATLVCTGDLIDKWTQGVEVVRLIRALQSRATDAGGRVIVTLGNHEAELLASNGDGAKAAAFITELNAQHIDAHAVAAGTDLEGIGAWLRHLPVAAKVNDWFFCHAGNTGGKTLAELEHEIEAGVDRDGFGAAVLAEPNSILEARVRPIPWWASSSDDEKKQKRHDATDTEAADRLRANAEALGCKHLVMGHQPGTAKFTRDAERPAGEPFAYAGVLFMIDTGMSRGVNDGRAVVLKIHTGEKEAKETVTVIGTDGKSTVLWSSK